MIQSDKDRLRSIKVVEIRSKHDSQVTLKPQCLGKRQPRYWMHIRMDKNPERAKIDSKAKLEAQLKSKGVRKGMIKSETAAAKVKEKE